MLLNAMMKSEAWLDLSGNAVKLLVRLAMLSEGNNGWGHRDLSGELFLSEREAAATIGVSRNTASRAFDELIDHGFLRVVRVGHFQVKVRVATAWRLTFQPYPRSHQGPTNEWREWRLEQKSRAQNLNGSGAKIGHMSRNPLPTGPKIAPVKSRNGAKLPSASGSRTAPHIDIPREGNAPARGKGWWGGEAAMQAHVGARLATLAWIGVPPIAEAA